MGKNSRPKVKLFYKLRTAVGVAALVFIFIAPVLALAQSSTPAPNPATTWNQTDCNTVGGQWDTTTNDCYTKEVASPIMISVGGATGSTTLTKYIAEFYKYLTAAAAVLAVIYLMIGGFQILASAGGDQVGEGRKHITSAILGLVLIFCSYVLLQTVNPALVNLQPPRIKLIKANYLSVLKPTNMIGQPCYTIQDKDACAASCPAAGLTASCECVVVPDTFFTYFAKATTWAAAGGAAVATIGVATIASAAQAVGGQLLRFLPSIISGLVTNLDKAAVAYGVYKAVSTDPGQEGICLPMAVNSIPVGGECDPNHPQGCIAPALCVKINADPLFGMCVSGAENTGCVTSETNICQSNMSCCEVANGLGTCQKDCSHRAVGMQCNTDSDCTSGSCAISAAKGYKVCVASAVSVLCTSNNDCDKVGSGYYCPWLSIDQTGSWVSVPSDSNTTIKNIRTCQSQKNAGAACCGDADCLDGNGCGRDGLTGLCQLNYTNGQYVLSNQGTCK